MQTTSLLVSAHFLLLGVGFTQQGESRASHSSGALGNLSLAS